MGDLIKINELAVSSVKDTDELLKPLSRDILLFSTKIAGIYALKDRKPVSALKEDDILTFRYQESKYGDNQIAILNEKEECVGYVPEGDAVIFLRLMDAGKMLLAKVTSISFAHSMPMIKIDIYLRDF